MPFLYPDGRSVDISEQCSLEELYKKGQLNENDSVFILGTSDQLSDSATIEPDETYFVVERPTNMSPMLTSICNGILLSTLISISCCFRFKSQGPFKTRKALEAILCELRGLGVNAFVCNAPRKLNVCPLLTDYKWDCCADCDTYGECNDDDFDWSPYQPSMVTRLDKEYPYTKCDSYMWILTFPKHESKFETECKIAFGIIPHREGERKSQRVRENNKYQINLTNSDGKYLESICSSLSTDRKRVTWSFVGPSDIIPVTREILEASKGSVDKNHEFYDNIQGQLAQMLARV